MIKAITYISHRFKKRDPRLSTRKPMSTSFARAREISKEEVDKVFNLLDVVFKKHNYAPNKVYNVDETGLSVLQSKLPLVIVSKGKKEIAYLTSAERGSLITIIPCMSVGGDFILLLVIFPNKNI